MRDDLDLPLYFASTLAVHYLAVWRGLRNPALRAFAAAVAWWAVSIAATLVVVSVIMLGANREIAWGLTESRALLALDVVLGSAIVALWTGLTLRVVVVVGIVSVAIAATGYVMDLMMVASDTYFNNGQ